MATTEDIYREIVQYRRSCPMPEAWPCISGDPAWVLLDAKEFLPPIKARFSDDDLIAAGILVKEGSEATLHPYFTDGPTLTFVVRDERFEPIALLPNGQSLTAEAAWQVILRDVGNKRLAEDGSPLIFAEDPEDLAVLRSLCLLVAPMPSFGQMNANFLETLNDTLDALAPSSMPRWHNVIIAGWKAAECTLQVPENLGDLIDHLNKLTESFQPDLIFKFWTPHPKTIQELKFRMTFGDENHVIELMRDRLDEDAVSILARATEVLDQPIADHFGKFLAACAKGAPVAERERQLVETITNLRQRLTDQIEASDCQTDPLNRMKLRLISDTAFIAYFDLLRSISENSGPQRTANGGKSAYPLAEALRSVRDVIALINAEVPRKPDVNQLLKLIG